MFIHALPDYAYLRGIVPQDDMPNARDFAARMLTLGNSAWQTREETAQILRALALRSPESAVFTASRPFSTLDS